MATVPGIDVYYRDVASAPLQIGLAKANGLGFIYAKATQGLTFADPAYSTISTQCATAGGVLFGAYHYFQPGDDPLAQATFFLNTASPVIGDLRPMLDVEPTQINHETVNPDANEAMICAKEIERVTGYFPWIYSGCDFYYNHLRTVFADAPGWLARYPGVNPLSFIEANPNAIYKDMPWPQMWQYTDHRLEPGTPAALDGDLYLNTIEDLTNRHVISLQLPAS